MHVGFSFYIYGAMLYFFSITEKNLFSDRSFSLVSNKGIFRCGKMFTLITNGIVMENVILYDFNLI